MKNPPFLGLSFNQLEATALAHGASLVTFDEPDGEFIAYITHQEYVWLRSDGSMGAVHLSAKSHFDTKTSSLLRNYTDFGFRLGQPASSNEPCCSPAPTGSLAQTT